MMDASHNHADAGRFVIDALGSHWTDEYSRETNGTEQSEVLVDGQGQGYFATPATWLGAVQTPDAAFGAADLAYTYSWQWRKQILMWSPQDPRLKSNAYASFAPQIQKFIDDGSRAIAEYDPSPAVKQYYAGYLAGDPRMWDEDSWIVRMPFNPLEYAYRTGGLVRGKYSYVMLIDDIKKDSRTHQYVWQMILNPDVVKTSETTKDGFTDIVLGMTDGHGHLMDQRLLVRVLQANNMQDSGQPYVEQYTNKNSYGQSKLVERLVIPSDSVTPEFKTLIYPFKTGAILPETSWNADHSNLSITFPEQHDAFKFIASNNGRTHAKMIRNGAEIFSDVAP
jgi:hypothetical protein